MGPITVSKTHDYFVQGGKPFFYLADTLWSAFTNTSFEEWEEFLNYRKMPEIRVAASPNNQKIVIYMPYNAELQLNVDLANYECVSFNLSERLVMYPEIEIIPEGSRINMHQFNTDVLIIGIHDGNSSTHRENKMAK
jgi:hypothetical protein